MGPLPRVQNLYVGEVLVYVEESMCVCKVGGKG